MRATPKIGHLQVAGGAPAEVGLYRRVIGQLQAVVGQVILTHIIQSGVQLDKGIAAIDDLVDDFTVGTGDFRITDQRVDTGFGHIAGAYQVDPGIAKTTIEKLPHIVATASVAGIGITHDDHGVSGGVGLDIADQLQHVGAASDQVGLFCLCLGMQIVDVDVHTFCQSGACQGKAFWGQAVDAIAGIPADPIPVGVCKTAHAVKTATDSHTSGGGRAIGVVVTGVVQRRVVVEIFLDVDDVKFVDVAADLLGGGLPVGVCAGKDFQQSGDVVGQGAEGSGVGLDRGMQQAKWHQRSEVANDVFQVSHFSVSNGGWGLWIGCGCGLRDAAVRNPGLEAQAV